jgi:hypothetical protein
LGLANSLMLQVDLAHECQRRGHRLFIANDRDSTVIGEFSPMPVAIQIRCSTRKHEHY